MQRMNAFIHQLDHWPEFSWRTDEFVNLLSEVRNLQGRLFGRMESLGFELKNEATLETLTLDVLKSTEIEGEILNPVQVRSSIARRLGMVIAGSVESDRNVDGMVEMMIDATHHCFRPLTSERLFDWHAALFPAAPESFLLETEMNRFLDWFNKKEDIDLVIKAAVAHVWFVTIHPFDDGNGRIARALTDMLLAQSDKSTQRFYSMSAQIGLDRKQYYEILERTQKGNLDITEWIQWFLRCLMNALKSTDTVLNRVLFKADFWNKHANTPINERQKKLLNKVFDGFEGKLTSSKWAKIAKCSKDTAIRDINDLISKNILQKEEAGGRSTNYELQ